MIYSIQHTTTYTYQEQVSMSYSRACLMPRTSDRQECLSFRLETTPRCTVNSERRDCYGNQAVYFSVLQPHREFSITAHSSVEVQPANAPEPKSTMPWNVVQTHLQTVTTHEARDAYQFIFPSRYIPVGDEFRDYAAPSFSDGRPILEAAVDLMTRINTEFTYDSLSTDLSTPVDEVLKMRKGVCQDFAHLQIACLRSIGIAARYVSGYLNTLPPPGQPKLLGADASHAWLSVYVPEHGWIDLDPTNDVIVNTDHVTLAWGRDFDEVSPLKGVTMGGGTHTLGVSVDVIEQPDSTPQPSQQQSQTQTNTSTLS